MDIDLDMQDTLRLFVSFCFYVVVSYGFVAWKYRTYYRVAPGVRPVLAAAHVFAAFSNIAAFFIFIGVDRHVPATAWQMWAGLAAAAAGTLFLAWGGLTLRIATFVPPENGEMVTGGPYRITTHPMYLGGLIAGTGLAVWAASMLALVYVLVIALTIKVIAGEEEKNLVERFGDAYLDYKRRTPIRF